jgi:hypothetical protein
MLGSLHLLDHLPQGGTISVGVESVHIPLSSCPVILSCDVKIKIGRGSGQHVESGGFQSAVHRREADRRSPRNILPMQPEVCLSWRLMVEPGSRLEMGHVEEAS